MQFFTVLNYFPFQVRKRLLPSSLRLLSKLPRSASHLYGRVKTSLKGGKMDGPSLDGQTVGCGRGCVKPRNIASEADIRVIIHRAPIGPASKIEVATEIEREMGKHLSGKRATSTAVRNAPPPPSDIAISNPYPDTSREIAGRRRRKQSPRPRDRSPRGRPVDLITFPISYVVW